MIRNSASMPADVLRWLGACSHVDRWGVVPKVVAALFVDDEFLGLPADPPGP